VDTTHEYRTIDQTMKIVHIGKKGRALDTYERFHICQKSNTTAVNYIVCNLIA
jgi:hypothetical protein